MMKRFIPLALIVLGLLLSVAAVGQLYFNYGASSTGNITLPQELAGLNLAQARTGSEALAEVADLHGKEFPVVSGAIGIYGDRQITLWVAAAQSESTAIEMTSAMQSKIAKGNSPFTPVKEIDEGAHKIHALEGMGQTHYYFQSENLVIWLAADPDLADKALQQILEVYS